MKSIKRKMRWIMYTALFLLLSACEKNEEAVLKPGIYTLQDYEREVPGDFTITICSNCRFTEQN